MSPKKFCIIPSYTNIPKEYSYQNLLPEVEDQSATHMCIPYSLSTWFNWNFNVNNGTNDDNHIDVKQIYKYRKTPGNKGMSFQSALYMLKTKGVNSDFGIIKISDYLLVDSILGLQQALLLNGPCVASIKLKTNKKINEFWEGETHLGNHAIAIVGYNENGFIIRNSWGKSYGDNGYYILPYGKFHNIVECWTIIIN